MGEDDTEEGTTEEDDTEDDGTTEDDTEETPTEEDDTEENDSTEVDTEEDHATENDGTTTDDTATEDHITANDSTTHDTRAHRVTANRNDSRGSIRDDECSIYADDNAQVEIDEAAAMQISAEHPASKIDSPGLLRAEYKLMLVMLRVPEWSENDSIVVARNKFLDSMERAKTERIRARPKAAEALDSVLEHARGAAVIKIGFILSLHKACLEGELDEAGQVRTVEVHFGSSKGIKASEVHGALANFCKEASHIASMPDVSGCAKAAWCAFNIIRIHPFRDGNGRISRLLAVWAFKRHGFPEAFSMSPLLGSGKRSRRAYVQAFRQHESEPTRALADHIWLRLKAQVGKRWEEQEGKCWYWDFSKLSKGLS